MRVLAKVSGKTRDLGENQRSMAWHHRSHEKKHSISRKKVEVNILECHRRFQSKEEEEITAGCGSLK